jgi:hypothetical protein
MARDPLMVWRFAAGGMSRPDALDPTIEWITEKAELPGHEAIVVSTAAKWSMIELADPFDVLFIDEAWQMSWCAFMPLQQVAPRFVLIGDPGQIPPVVPIPAERWETSPRAPHHPAPEVILNDPGISKLALKLPCCRRLPSGNC